MRLSAVYIAIVVAIGGTAASSWFARYAPWVERRPSAPHPLLSRVRAMEEGAARRAGATRQAAEGGIQKLDPAVDARPPVADGALSPKAVAAERVYEFGHMGINETRKHSFRMENQGRVPLAIAKGPTECKCTISKLTTREVPPGGFAEIEIAWTPREADPDVRKIGRHLDQRSGPVGDSLSHRRQSWPGSDSLTDCLARWNCRRRSRRQGRGHARLGSRPRFQNPLRRAFRPQRHGELQTDDEPRAQPSRHARRLRIHDERRQGDSNRKFSLTSEDFDDA